MSIVKHGDDSIMLCGVFSSAVTGALMNSSKYQSILAQNLHSSAKTLKMKRNFTFQHDNDPKHNSNQQRNGFNQIRSRFWNGPTRV